MAATILIAKPTFFFLQSSLLKPNPLLLNPPDRFQPWFLRSHKLQYCVSPVLNLRVNDNKPSALNICFKHSISTKNLELANLILIRECDDANNTDDDDDVVVDMSSSKEIREEKNQARKLDQSVASEALRNPAAAVLPLVALIMLFIYDPESAFAASGGRMGGRSFSSSSSRSSSSSSSRPSSYSSSSKQSYSSSRSSSSSSSRSSSSSSSRSSSYSSSSKPSYSSSSSQPSSQPSSSPSSQPSSSVLRNSLKKIHVERKKSYPMPSSGRYEVTSKRSNILVPSSLLEEEDSSRFSCSQVVDAGGNTGGAYSQDGDGDLIIFLVWCLLMVLIIKPRCFDFLLNPGCFEGAKLQNARKIVATQRTSVLKLQVGLLGSRSSLQRDLNQIAETADTSTKKGLSYILTETIVALLRYPDYWSSAYSSADVKDNTDEGETRFNELSIEERAKLDEETLVNVDSMKKRSSTIKRISGVSNEYIVVTILVAAEGEHKMPTVNYGLDLKEALQKLASIGSSETLAVEVLWTPQNEDDVLSEEELLQKYSLLRPL